MREKIQEHILFISILSDIQLNESLIEMYSRLEKDFREMGLMEAESNMLKRIKSIQLDNITLKERYNHELDKLKFV